MKVGDRVVVQSTMSLAKKLIGQSGKITRQWSDGATVSVELDSEPGRARVFYVSSLRLENVPMSNFKTLIKAFVEGLLTTITNPKDAAVRKLGVGSELARLGEATKKAAKTELEKLGVIKPGSYDTGSQLIYDSPSYTITAETKAAATRLDGAKLQAAMLTEGVSLAKTRKIIAAVTVENAASTSYKVEQK